MVSPSHSPRRAVQPLSGVAPYQGGKRLLADRIIARIEAVPHRCYAEPFVGMGGVFFRRPNAAPVEAINDVSVDVATFFRVLQRHYLALVDLMRWQLTARAEFNRLMEVRPDTLTDMERAARFYYLQKCAFGGKVRGRTFGIDPNGRPKFDVTRLANDLLEYHGRLAGVWIEQLPFADFIRRYDRARTLFFCDPPYFGCEDDYGTLIFARDDFAVLAGLLRGIKGRFLLSINDVPEIREIFDGFAIEPVATTYSVGGGAHAKRVRELLISNPP